MAQELAARITTEPVGVTAFGLGADAPYATVNGDGMPLPPCGWSYSAGVSSPSNAATDAADAAADAVAGTDRSPSDNGGANSGDTHSPTKSEAAGAPGTGTGAGLGERPGLGTVPGALSPTPRSQTEHDPYTLRFPGNVSTAPVAVCLDLPDPHSSAGSGNGYVQWNRKGLLACR